MAATLSYTPPADIDGEPEDVRELSLQQLGEAIAAVAKLTDETITQLRAAGVGREGEDWTISVEGRAAVSLAGDFWTVLNGFKRLQSADSA